MTKAITIDTPPPGEVPIFEQREFGRYTLLYRFASGGMARLYIAKLVGTDGFSKLVALKVIHEHLTDDPNFVKMFIDEARLAALISHPNVVQTIELGCVEGIHFIAMEYVNGESLSALARSRRLPPSICARILTSAAAGLHAAHELRGKDGRALQVVHRDVSPQNILVSYDGEVKVVDFGVARMRGGLHETVVGALKGKFGYAAPEQLMKDRPLDRRVDTFALGVLLFEMTTRTRLFKAENDAQTAAKVLECKIPAPSSIVEGYPPVLEQVVFKALSRDPAQRYQTAQELQEDLERFLFSCGEPVLSVQVAAVMKEIFAEHIREKEELLRLGEDMGEIVVPEDERVSDVSRAFEAINTMPGITPPQASLQPLQLQQPQQTQQPGGRSRLWIAVVVVALVALAGALILALGTSSEEDRRPARDAAAVTTPTPKKPEEVRVRLQASPASATIRFDGHEVTNPYELRRPVAQREVEAVVSAPGYESRSVKVSLAVGGRFIIELTRLAAPAKKSADARPDQKRPAVKKPGGRRPPRRPPRKPGGKKPRDPVDYNPYAK